MTIDEQLINETSLAELLGESVRTQQGRRLRGEGVPFVKIGSHVRYRMTDVRHFLDENTKRSTSDT